MDARVIHLMDECTKRSEEGRLNFPQVVMRLIEAGVEKYHADLRRAEKTYYLPNGESHVTPCATVAGGPAQIFSADGVESAIRAI